MNTKALGKNALDLNLKGKKLLDKIKRKKFNIGYGVDIWNVYDFLYLDKNKIPSLKVLEILIPASSTFTIESKSMKLYLNDYHDKSYRKDSDLIKDIKNDIEELVESRVSIKLINKFYDEPNNILLNIITDKKSKPNTVLKFNGFRSICPVTSQPDFANIYIYSDISIDTKWLVDYLISYHNHGGFHEECINNIFVDIRKKCKAPVLQICGRFQRRGGIDINPIRSTSEKLLFSNFREFNQ